MNEASTKAADKDDEADGVHRLRDIVVEEVSLVDRAANKRRFLVVKRSGDMADESHAGIEAEAKKAPAHEDDAEDAEKARTASKDDEEEEDAADRGDEKTKRRKKEGALVLPAGAKPLLLRTLTEALERLMSVANRVKGATESDGASMPKEVGAELAAVADLVHGIDKRKAAKADVAKAGARMSKDRLDRFQKALSLLADILKEITDAKEALSAPSAGGAETGVAKNAAAPAANVPGLTELVSGIGELTRVVKRQEEELGRIRQTRGVSNAIAVDGGRRTEVQDVSWPLDMNRPISRDKVRKEVSFFDE